MLPFASSGLRHPCPVHVVRTWKVGFLRTQSWIYNFKIHVFCYSHSASLHACAVIEIVIHMTTSKYIIFSIFLLAEVSKSSLGLKKYIGTLILQSYQSSQSVLICLKTRYDFLMQNYSQFIQECKLVLSLLRSTVQSWYTVHMTSATEYHHQDSINTYLFASTKQRTLILRCVLQL